MRTAIALAIVLPMLSGLPAWAQSDAPGDDSQPAASNIAGQPYPRIHADLRATFRLRAPEAQKVRVHVDKDYDLQRDNQGVWSVTTTPLVPGFHYYWFIMDGVNVCDPASETFYGTGRQASGIEVPSKGEDFYELKDVPHGEIRERPISRRPPALGGASSSTRRPTTTPTATLATLCSICSTGLARTSEAGARKVA